MLSRKKAAAPGLNESGIETFAPSEPQQLQGRPATSESSARIKTYSEGSSLGIFRRGKQYDELLDDATSGSPPETSSFITGDGRTSLSDDEAERPTTRTAAIQAQRTSSGGVAESLISRLTMKDKRAGNGGGMGGFSKGADEASDIPARTPQPAVRNGSTSKTASFGGSVKPPPGRAPTPSFKKSRMQGSDFQTFVNGESEVLTSGEKSPRDEDAQTSDATAAKPATPGRASEHAAPIGRPSPSLISTAAKLAASLQQGSKRALTRKNTGEMFTLMDDSAAEADDDIGRTLGPDVGESNGASPSNSAPPFSSSKNGGRALRVAEATSPGTKQPLLLVESSSPDPSVISGGAAESSRHTLLPGQQALPARPAAGMAGWQVHNHAGSDAEGGSAPDHRGAVQMEENATDGVAEDAAYDIFEPRPASMSLEDNLSSTLRAPKPAAASPSIAEVSRMKGHDALKTLQKGSNLRKKWVNSTSAVAAAQAPKTERLIRCRMEGSKVVLHYHHQGVKGFLDKEEVITHVQRVEVLDGPWRKGDCILLHTGRGVLALEAPDAATHATWMLGLNAALVSSQTRGREVLLEAPVRAIPRNSMFVVTPQ